MFWISSAVIGMSVLLIKFGELSVMTGVLTMALKALSGLVVLLVGLLTWRWCM
jgi:hypothetical protein